MKKFVVGDIHGGLKALVQILEKASVTSDDTIIFLGDYVDGWSESPQVLDFLIDLQTAQNCIFLRGNHDDLLLQYLKTNTYKEEWFLHGGEATLAAYQNVSEEKKQHHISFLENLQNYYLDEENRLFIHAGFTNSKGVAYEYFKPMFYWDRSLWEMAIALNPNLNENDILYPSRLKHYKEIYIGHTPVTRIEKEIPVQAANIWNIDTGAAFKGKLSIMDIDSKMYWQSEALPKLYPNEKGRN
ncbi:metallophosphoesterase family protein [Flavobacterium sp.]|uniref:metallophosphoesterase family protein n=1 Tax=Flavobacterium sp. TaxID=239 RepID=UPI003529AB2F